MKSKLRISKILPRTSVEGPGNRYCLWVQGCPHHCKGCWAENTWDFDAGAEVCSEAVIEEIQSVSEIEGITLLGGEPFAQAEALCRIAEASRQHGLSVLCFTGYTLEELVLRNNPAEIQLLSQIDLLIDGRFEKEQFDLSRPWVGSKNQRYLFLTERYSMADVYKRKAPVEVHIDKNGAAFVNGMGNFKKLEKMLKQWEE